MTTNIVLTGGPCAGKTTCLSILRTALAEQGYNVCVIPEVATLLFTSGQTHNTPTKQCRSVLAPKAPN
jgi:thymidylate kinase